MEKLLLTLVTLALASSCRSQSPSCSDCPCPNYQVVEKNEDFEERRYANSDWITTNLTNRDGPSLMAAAKRLRAFCDAQKEAGHDIFDGWPALIVFVDGQTPFAGLSWFLAPGSKPEVTEDTSVKVQHISPVTVYVRSYSGIPSTAAAVENKRILSEALTKAGKTFNSDISIGAHYESYYAFSHHNEIWLFSP